MSNSEFMASALHRLNQRRVAPGMIQQGNIDLNHRPVITNDDGSTSTIFSATIPVEGGKFALIPTIAGGKFLTPSGKKPDEGNKKAMQALIDAATDHYENSGEHLGIFDSEDSADNFANLTHAYLPNGGPEQVFLPSPYGGMPAPAKPSSTFQKLRAVGQ